MGLPPALASSLEAEGGEPTPLQASLWEEGRAGGDLLVEASSGPAANTAIAVLSLVSVVDAVASAEAAIPLYLRRRTGSYGGLAFNKIVSNVFGSGRAGKKSASAEEEGAAGGGGGGGGSGGGGGFPTNGPKPQLHVLVLTKNREIAAGVADTLRRLGKGCVPDLAVATLVGGVAVAENAKTLEGGCHIAVGTPGRVKFLMEKGVLLLETARLLVFESADWLMAPVFLEDVRTVVGKFPQEKQVVACSTVKPSQEMEEDLCSLLEVPALRRLDASGTVLDSRVRMPPNPLPSPSARSTTSAAASCFVPYDPASSADARGGTDTAGADRIDGVSPAGRSSSASGSGGGGGGGEGRPSSISRGAAARAAAAAEEAAAAEARARHARPSQHAIVAVASAKERLLMETRRALSISGRICADSAGGGAPIASTAAAPAAAAAAAAAAAPAAVTQLPRKRAMTSDAEMPVPGPAPNTAATAVTSAAADDDDDDTDASRRRSHRVRGLRRTLSGTSDRAPPPAYSLVSRGVFQTTSTVAASCTSASTEEGNERRPVSAPRTGGFDGDSRWKAAGGGGGGGDGGGVMSRAGAQDDDAASTLGLLSPGAFKGGVAAMVAVLDKKQHRRLPGEGGEGAAATADGGARGRAGSPVAVVTNSVKRLAISVGEEGPSSLDPQAIGTGAQQQGQQQEQQQQQQQQQQQEQQQQEQQQQEQQHEQQGSFGLFEGVSLPKCCSSSSLLREEGWNFPADLLSTMEANGVLLPTSLQESVWKGGRGSAREDLLVHGRPGDETATAFCVPVLERVLERYPSSLANDSESAEEERGRVERKAPAWDAEEEGEEQGGSRSGEGRYELVALVLTRTRDMAADITETLNRLGDGIPSLSVATLIGGVPVADNRKALLDGLGCNVVVGTPGRVKFLIQEGVLSVSLSASRMLVLDSADWLMAPVFQDDVGWIASQFPKEKQVLAFSGADPAAYKDGLTALVGSAGLTPIGGIRGGSSEGSVRSSSSGGGGSCTSTAVILEQGEAAAAALTGAAAAAFAPSRPAATMPAGRGSGPGPGAQQPAASGPSSVHRAERGGGGGGAGYGSSGEAGAPRGAACSSSTPGFSPAFAAAPAAPAGTAGPRPPVGGVVWPPPSAGAASGGRSREGGRASPAPTGRRKTSPIRTLGMMREESALRAQGLGWAYGNHVPGTAAAAVAAGGPPPAVVAAGTASSNTSAVGSPPTFLARGSKAGGGGRGGVASGGSSTASVSSTSSTFRAKIRSAAENDMYGSWCA